MTANNLVASSDNHEVKLLHTDINGNNYYEFINVEVLPFMRLEAYHAALAAAERRINDEMLLKRVEQMTKAFDRVCANNNDHEAKKNFYDIVTDINVRMSLACERNTSLSLAKTFILIEGEPINPNVSEMEYWNKKKEIAWVADNDTLFFCAAKGAGQITNLKNIAISELIAYLKTQSYESQ